MEILFYHPDEPHGFLSNYFEHAFTLGNVSWRTVEHYYQAQKFSDAARVEKTRLYKVPDSAKSYTHGRKQLWHQEQNEVKVEIMRHAVRAKFTQPESLAEKLIATGKATLIENSLTDLLWGIGFDGNGKNVLGKILMETGATINEE